MRVALRKAAVPCALWNDGDHSGAERKRLGRSVVADDFQGRRPVEDVNQLITGEMAFPMVSPGGLEPQKQPVAIGSQSRDASLCLFLSLPVSSVGFVETLSASQVPRRDR